MLQFPAFIRFIQSTEYVENVVNAPQYPVPKANVVVGDKIEEDAEIPPRMKEPTILMPAMPFIKIYNFELDYKKYRMKILFQKKSFDILFLYAL